MDLNAMKTMNVLLIVLLGVLLVNTYVQFGVASGIQALSVAGPSNTGANTGGEIISAATTPANDSGALSFAEVAEQVIPKGVPAVYGAELGISFDDAEAALPILANLDRTIMFDEMSEENQERYGTVGTSISCKYCCGAESVAFADGKPACGCEHSFGMRGVMKYLLQEHGDEFTNEEILEETFKWRTAYFPQPTVNEILELQATATGGAVNTDVSQLPQQVGGC